MASSVDRIRQQEIAPLLPAFVFTETAQGGVIPRERSETENNLPLTAPSRDPGQQVGHQLPPMGQSLHQLRLGLLQRRRWINTAQISNGRRHRHSIRLGLEVLQSRLQFSRRMDRMTVQGLQPRGGTWRGP